MKKNKRLRRQVRAFTVSSVIVLMLLVMLIPLPARAEDGDNILSILMAGENADTVRLVIMLTILSLLPSLLVMVTAFTRILIVLSFMRTAIGTQQVPPNMVLIGLAIFLSLIVMAPAVDSIQADALTPYLNDEITADVAFDRAMAPLREFMLTQTSQDDLDFFLGASRLDAAMPLDEIPLRTVIPAFMISELKRAFQMGFLLFLPFIVIDMVVASTLMSMGMMMLPPSMIALPFKLLLFVMVDGWTLLIGSLISSFIP